MNMKVFSVTLLFFAGMIGLWEWMDHSHWFFLILAFAVAIYSRIFADRKDAPLKQGADDFPATQVQTKILQSTPPKPLTGDHYIECRSFMDRGNWNAARTALMRIAYRILSQPKEEQERFKTLMAEFSERDPLVGVVAKVVLPLLRSQPGILQTELYQHVPNFLPEQTRQALHFMEQLHMIERKKIDGGYELFESRSTINL